MSAALNAFAPAANYNDAGTLRAPLSERVNIFIERNQGAVRVQFGQGRAGPAWDATEEHYPPGYFSIDRPCDWVRVRLAPGVASSVVTITARTAAEIS